MRRAVIHRVLVFLLSVALATGLTARVVRSDTMGTTMAAMASDMPMHGKCNGCAGSEKAMVPMVCGAFCAGMVALASPSIVFDSVLAGFVVASVEPAVTGHAFPPDPYPPKPASMN